jgi:hypothetical protein
MSKIDYNNLHGNRAKNLAEPVDSHDAATKNYVDTAEALNEKLANKDTTTTLGTSDTKYPSQNAVKAYADTKMPGTQAGYQLYSSVAVSPAQTSNSVSYVDITNATMTLAVARGNPVILMASLTASKSSASYQLVVAIREGTTVLASASNSMVNATTPMPITVMGYATGLSVGNHTIKLSMSVADSSVTATIAAYQQINILAFEL